MLINLIYQNKISLNKSFVNSCPEKYYVNKTNNACLKCNVIAYK